jgi:hypothetical protein
MNAVSASRQTKTRQIHPEVEFLPGSDPYRHATHSLHSQIGCPDHVSSAGLACVKLVFGHALAYDGPDQSDDIGDTSSLPDLRDQTFYADAAPADRAH